MGPPDITNDTPFALAPLFIADARNRPVFVPVIKATYLLDDDDRLTLSEQQEPPNLAGEYRGDPETTSLKYEPESAYCKLSTDVVMIGAAHAPNGKPAPRVTVGLRVGPVQKVVNVVGDRLLSHRAGVSFISEPVPFVTMPLTYELAFGGWDRSDADEAAHGFDPRNPVGRFHRKSALRLAEDLMLPNIEDPDHPFRRLGDMPPPAGFGFISPHWLPRATFAGTYDKAWDASRKPLLPLDFDPRFFNAASPGLVTPAYLNGDESVVVLHASPRERVEFRLPGAPAPICEVIVRGRTVEPLQTRLDTVIVDMDERRVHLLWRTHVPLPGGPHQLVSATLH